MNRANGRPLVLGATGIVLAGTGLVMIAVSEPGQAALWSGAVVLLAGLVTAVTGAARINDTTSARWRGNAAASPGPGTSKDESPARRPGRHAGADPGATAPHGGGPPQDAYPGDARRARLLGGSDCIAPTIGQLSASFNAWLDQHLDDPAIWPAFDRWLRDAVNQFIRGRRVRCFRVTRGEGNPVSLTDEADNALWYGAVPHGLIDHVIAGGQRYIAGGTGTSALVEKLADEWRQADPASGRTTLRPPDMLLPVRADEQTIGFIVVGELDAATRDDLATLHAVANILETCWRLVACAHDRLIARQTDRDSGVLNRLDLTRTADEVLNESAREGEPVVIMALLVEGVRRLDDGGRWAMRDWLMKQIGDQMQQKLRSDDLIGRFSDDHFVAVLRRLDVTLGQMIAGKLLDVLRARMDGRPELGDAVRIRCGLADAPGETLESSLARAFDALREARERDRDIVVRSAESAPAQSAVEANA